MLEIDSELFSNLKIKKGKMAGFVCEFCRKVFTLNRNLRRHIRLCHDGLSTSFKCIQCNKYFSSQSYYLQHSKIGDGGETINTITCTDCSQHIPKTNWYILEQMLIDLIVLAKFEMMTMVLILMMMKLNVLD